MLKTAAITLFALFLSACVPIPQEPSQAVCHEGFVVMRAGQSAYDPIVSDLPGHVDIVKAETSLDGETLIATFHFKDVPETMGLNREGMPFSTFEYFYTVNINIDGGPIYQSNLSDYTLAAFNQARNMGPSSAPLQNILHAVLWKNRVNKDEITVYFDEVPGHVGLEVSHQNDTLTMTAHVPGITQDSTVLFLAEDYLSGMDGVSCEAN